MLNKATLLGRITKDLNLNYTDNGKEYLKFNIAVNRENEKKETDFINCLAWGKMAELIAKYFSKGDRILVHGMIQTGNYEKNGVKNYTFEILVKEVNFIENKYNNNNYKNYTYNTNNHKEVVEEFPF